VTLTQGWISHFYEIALLVSTRSKDPSTRVGALVVDDARRIVGSGYNGFPRGVDDDPARYADRPVKLAMVVHAEVNAILNAAKSVRGCVLVSMRGPCSACSGVIIQSGIDRVVCPDLPANSKWQDDWMLSQQMLREAGVPVDHAPLPRHGRTQEEYYVDGLRVVSNYLRPSHRADCDSVGVGPCRNGCDMEPMTDMAEETISRLLRGKSL
jgi:deoxycytidylate deaminase